MFYIANTSSVEKNFLFGGMRRKVLAEKRCTSYVNTQIPNNPEPAMKISADIRRRRGFTLAEVMVALAIVSTVMIGLLGMIPMAERSIRESANLAIQGRIAQELLSNIQMADWVDIDNNFRGQVFKFDQDGLPFMGRPEQGGQPTYEARIVLPQEQIKIGALTFSTANLRRVLIDVEFTPGGVKVQRNADRNTRRFNMYVANQSKL